ncbi:MAG TPA: hypothetical protein VGE05_08615, partial [Novosphingobium sp.]
ITTHTHPRPYCRAHTTSAGRTARSLLSTPRRTPGLASGRSNAPAFGAAAVSTNRRGFAQYRKAITPQHAFAASAAVQPDSG